MTNIFRFNEEQTYRNTMRRDNIDTYWDSDYDLADTGGWDNRHKYEASIISGIIKEYNITKAIELGAGTGNLGNKIITENKNCLYHMLDGESAVRAHARRKYAGAIIVRDLLDSFDITGLDTDYDLVVANDFIEHIRNPSIVLQAVREKITNPNSYFFASSPNWRMKHHFYYPGLFDFDNFIKFFWQEGYEVIAQYPSWANHVPVRIGRLDSEKLLADEHILDWNHYLLFKKMT